MTHDEVAMIAAHIPQHHRALVGLLLLREFMAKKNVEVVCPCCAGAGHLGDVLTRCPVCLGWGEVGAGLEGWWAENAVTVLGGGKAREVQGNIGPGRQGDSVGMRHQGRNHSTWRDM